MVNEQRALEPGDGPITWMPPKSDIRLGQRYDDFTWEDPPGKIASASLLEATELKKVGGGDLGKNRLTKNFVQNTR